MLSSEGNSARTLAMLAMTDAALGQVDSLPWGASAVEGQRSHGGIVVSVHIENVRLRVECRTTPLGAAFKAWINERVFAHAERDELPIVANLAQPLYRPIVRLRSPVGQVVLREFCRAKGSGIKG